MDKFETLSPTLWNDILSRHNREIGSFLYFGKILHIFDTVTDEQTQKKYYTKPQALDAWWYIVDYYYQNPWSGIAQIQAFVAWTLVNWEPNEEQFYKMFHEIYNQNPYVKRKKEMMQNNDAMSHQEWPDPTLLPARYSSMIDIRGHTDSPIFLTPFDAHLTLLLNIHESKRNMISLLSKSPMDTRTQAFITENKETLLSWVPIINLIDAFPQTHAYASKKSSLITLLWHAKPSPQDIKYLEQLMKQALTSWDRKEFIIMLYKLIISHATWAPNTVDMYTNILSHITKSNAPQTITSIITPDAFEVPWQLHTLNGYLEKNQDTYAHFRKTIDIG